MARPMPRNSDTEQAIGIQKESDASGAEDTKPAAKHPDEPNWNL